MLLAYCPTSSSPSHSLDVCFSRRYSSPARSTTSVVLLLPHPTPRSTLSKFANHHCAKQRFLTHWKSTATMTTTVLTSFVIINRKEHHLLTSLATELAINNLNSRWYLQSENKSLESIPTQGKSLKLLLVRSLILINNKQATNHNLSDQFHYIIRLFTPSALDFLHWIHLKTLIIWTFQQLLLLSFPTFSRSK